MGNKKFLYLIVLAVPLVAFGISQWLLGAPNNGADRNLLLMRWISLSSAALGVGLLAGISVAGYLSRSSRSILLYLFRPGLYLTLGCVIVIVVAHAYLAMASIYYLEAEIFGRVHLYLLGAIGLGAVFGIASMLVAIVGIWGKRASVEVAGQVLLKEGHPALWNIVEDLAARVGTAIPDSVVAGMDLTFFVTEADVRCSGIHLKGRTLYVSLQLCRILSVAELKAVLVHELSHFKGEDTLYSQKFYPIYRGAVDALQGLGSEMDEVGKMIPLLPAFSAMTFFLEAFAVAESDISKKRELAADQASSSIAGSDSVTTALIKVYAFSKMWELVELDMRHGIEQNQRLENASELFEQTVNARKESLNYEELDVKDISHPTDSHPPIWLRLEWVRDNRSSEEIPKHQIIAPVEHRAVELVSGYEDIEKDLTRRTHAAMIDAVDALPGIALPKEPEKKSIPGVREWSSNLNSETVGSFLERLSHLIEKGFSEPQMIQTATMMKRMKPGDMRELRFLIRYKEAATEIRFRIHKNAADSLDLHIFANPDLAEEIDREFRS